MDNTLKDQNLNTQDIEKLKLIFKPALHADEDTMQAQIYIGLNLLERYNNKFKECLNYENLFEQLNKFANENSSKKKYDEFSKHQIFEIFLILYKIFYYTEVVIQSEEDSFQDAYNYIKYAEENFTTFDILQRSELMNSALHTPIKVARSLLHSQEVKTQIEFINTYKDAKSFKEKWDSEYKENKKNLEELSKNIEKTRSEYNFVGLVDGFKQIKTQKEAEIKNSYCSMITAGFFMIFIPIAFAFLGYLGEYLDKAKYWHALGLLIPAFTIELLTLYFFRIFLHQYKSIQAQILQIDLRVSLCQFIESYITYKSKNMKNNDDALNKFESLIFSGIVADAGSIPSTFDGIEQVASIIKSLGSTRA